MELIKVYGKKMHKYFSSFLKGYGFIQKANEP